MTPFPFVTALGFLLLGFIICMIAYPRILGWAQRFTNEFHRGKCSYCDRETHVTACKRCGKDVAFCHYYSVLGTDIDHIGRFGKRRSNQICTGCLSVTERDQLEALLKK